MDVDTDNLEPSQLLELTLSRVDLDLLELYFS